MIGGRPGSKLPEVDAVHQVVLNGTDTVFAARPGESVLNAARRAGHWLPYECGWGSCARCKATLVAGDVECLFPEAPAIDPRDGRRRRVLLCQSAPVGDIVVKPLGVSDGPTPERPTADYRGTLVHVRHLGPDIAEFTFELRAPDGRSVISAYRPGQYAILELAPGLRRCYSMAGLPGRSQVEFIAKRYAGRPGSTRLFELPLGTTVPLELPYGDMWLRDRDRPTLLVAGGTGVSAILSLLRGIAADPAWAHRPVYVLYGAANAAELVCWEELHSLAATLPRAQVHGALVTADDTWTGTRGFITETLTRLLGGDVALDHDLGDSVVYLAGPPPMVRAVQDVLDAHGLQRDRIHVDSFG